MMDRRQFIGTAGATAGLTVAGTGCGGSPGQPAGVTVDSLAGLSLTDLRARYEDDLFGRFLPFMDRHVVDKEYGGFMCAVRPDGSIVSTGKRAVYEGRGIWMYSYLYNNIAREQNYLDIAERSLMFILKHKPRGAKPWPTAFSREGKALDDGGGTVNADLYLADGLQQFAVATGDTQWSDLAREVLMKSLYIYDGDDYTPPAGAGYLGKNAPPTKGMRILDDWMLFLWPAVQMRGRVADTDLLMLVTQSIDTLVNRYYNKETGFIHELLEHDYRRPKNDYSQIVNFGNSFQAVWHLMAAAEQVGNRDLFEKATAMLRHHIETAWDDVYGGMMNVCMHVDENRWRLAKAHYVQCEALSALMRVIARTGEDWAREWYGRIDAYERETFILDGRGYKTWMNSSDRFGTFAFDSCRRIGNFHNPRRLLLDMVALDGLIARAGQVEGWGEAGEV